MPEDGFMGSCLGLGAMHMDHELVILHEFGADLEWFPLNSWSALDLRGRFMGRRSPANLAGVCQKSRQFTVDLRKPIIVFTLDFAREVAQKQGKVRLIPKNPYSRWRALVAASWTLQESADSSRVTERFLQSLWHHQRLQRDHLTTLDGESLRVLHPGFWNREAGPDFRDAVLKFGTAAPTQGDVEIDLHPHLWKSHGHNQNPAYRKVVLHVVWEGEPATPCALPTLALKPHLDAPLSDLSAWLGQNSLPRIPLDLFGKCAAPLRDLPIAQSEALLKQAAEVRLQAKAAQIQARAQQAGWEQSLWEGLFGALGYKHNVWPMRLLAEQLPSPATDTDRTAPSPVVWQARLLGLGGLLPTQLIGTAPQIDAYLRGLWDIWWREREAYSESILPRVAWRFNGLRPANHPQRRLALAAHWLASGDLPSRLEQWFAQSIADEKLSDSLLDVLQVKHDDLWSRHWTLRSSRMPQPQPLIGPQRVTDLAVNVILPWFWIRAVAGKSAELQARAEQRYFAWPRSEDNAVLRLARARLFGGQKVRWIKTASAQQGLLQIVRDFCDHSNALCDQCQFPELVRELGRGDSS